PRRGSFRRRRRSPRPTPSPRPPRRVMRPARAPRPTGRRAARLVRVPRAARPGWGAGRERHGGPVQRVLRHHGRTLRTVGDLAGGNGTTGSVTSTAMRRALRRAAEGRTLDVDETAVLLAARGEALDDLLAAAAAVRDA